MTAEDVRAAAAARHVRAARKYLALASNMTYNNQQRALYANLTLAHLEMRKVVLTTEASYPIEVW